MPEQQSDQPRASVILAAAGSGTRLRAGAPKAFVELSGRTLLEHALRGIESAGIAAEVVVLAPESHLELARGIARGAGSGARVIAGGAERADSVRLGLAALKESDPDAAVLVHDCARPLAPAGLYRAAATAIAEGADAAVPALPVADTIRELADDGEPRTLERSRLRACQTPQGFRLGALLDAAARPAGGDAAPVTDEAALIEGAGGAVRLVDGDEAAFKITTPLDLALAEALLRER